MDLNSWGPWVGVLIVFVVMILGKKSDSLDTKAREDLSDEVKRREVAEAELSFERDVNQPRPNRVAYYVELARRLRAIRENRSKRD